MNKIVSIAMATYNGEKFLKEQLDSILNQTYKNLELIICDDCSTDNTINIIKDFQKKDRRIKLYQNKQQLGVLKNFEKAISLCSGEYIAISDQDDIWVANKIEIMLSEIEENILIYHDDLLIDRSGNLIHNSFFESNEIFINKEHKTKALIFDNWISGHASMFSSLLKKDILPIPCEMEHYDMWIAIVASKVGKIKYLNKQLVLWRQHGTNTSGSKIATRGLWQKIFRPIDDSTFIQWNKHRIKRLKFLKNQKLFRDLDKFLDEAINYYTLSSRLRAFFFALLNIEFIVQKRCFLRKVKYIFLPLFSRKVKID